jgi:membrane associated rhomboid family serine protease
MSLNSVNTNMGAMVALSSLEKTQQDLSVTQKQISTGYRVADSTDDGAAYAVAQNVRSQVGALTAANHLLNVFVFALELMGGDPFVLKWAAVPANIVAGHGWITILTAMFLHGSWSHLIGNMIFLWAFGPEIEDAMNPFRYTVFYLAGGLVAMLAQVAASPNSTVPALGASGAIAAVMGAFIITYPRDEIRSLLIILVFVKVTYIPAGILIGFWFLTQLMDAGTVATAQTGGVAYLAHVGGFIFGVATARLFETPRGVTEEG